MILFCEISRHLQLQRELLLSRYVLAKGGEILLLLIPALP